MNRCAALQNKAYTSMIYNSKISLKKQTLNNNVGLGLSAVTKPMTDMNE